MLRLALRPAWISFGGTAAIVTSMGLILGPEAAGSSTRAIVSALLIVAVADNLSDSLSVHVYQEAEGLEPREALRSTLVNFAARLLVAVSFVGLALALSRDLLAPVALSWGFLLLALLTWRIARARRAHPGKEIARHFLIALAVLGASRALGAWIAERFV